MNGPSVAEILVLFEEAVSYDRTFAALRNELDKSKTLAHYMRLLAADEAGVDVDAAAKMSISLVELHALQAQAMRVLKAAVAAK